jgi:hypothetical protein
MTLLKQPLLTEEDPTRLRVSVGSAPLERF